MDMKHESFIVNVFCILTVIITCFIWFDIHEATQAQTEYVKLLRGVIEKNNYTIIPITR